MLKILIIGGSSLVGSTISHYAKNSFDLHLTYNDLIPKNFPSTHLDLINERSSIEKIIKKINPDFVVHTVAFPSVDFCETNHDKAKLLHVDITDDIATYCKDIDSPLLYFSTDAVFDGILSSKYKESDTVNPQSYYGKTKLLAEKLILEKNKKNIILRTTVIYGSHTRSRFTNWVVDSLKNNNTVTAFTDQSNTPTLVDDLAQSTLQIFEKNLSGLYHACGKTCISRYDFALKLAKSFGLDKSNIQKTLISEKKQIAPRPKYGCLDSTKLETSLDFEFMDIDSGIKFLVDKS